MAYDLVDYPGWRAQFDLVADGRDPVNLKLYPPPWANRAHGDLALSASTGAVGLTDWICCEFFASVSWGTSLTYWQGAEGTMRTKNPFRGRQFTADVILCALGWYLQFPVNYIWIRSRHFLDHPPTLQRIHGDYTSDRRKATFGSSNPK